MLTAVLVLSVMVVVLIGIFILRQWNLKKMNKQLQQIIQQFGTNELLRSNLPGKELNKLVTNVNQLITLFKKEEQATIRKNKELKQEITNISHDIRTPLTSIKGFSELLQDPQLTQEEKEEYLLIVQRKVDTLMRTVNLFYEISCLESEEEQLEIQHFPLGDLLVESLLTFQRDFESRQLAVTIDEENLSVLVSADKKGTERIILNLIQNALRYSTSFFQVSIREAADFWLLQTRNDNEALDLEEVEKIFERSYTVDSSRQDGQTGLGLYIVKMLAERQGGHVVADYKKGVFSLDVYFRKG